MLTSKTDIKTETAKQSQPNSASTASRGEELDKKNPLWQSFALRPAGVQTKLTVSQPGDSYEQEADRGADHVMRSAAPGGDQHLNAKAPQQPQVDSASVPAIVHEAVNSSGQPLDSGTRSDMEQHFDQDFSGVRVHTSAKAAESARALDASAYTVGSDIVFAGAQYAPGAAAGRKLLAHELSHVVQQQGASTAGMTVQRKANAIRFQDEPTLDEVSEGKKVLKEGDKGEAVMRITTALAETGHYALVSVDQNFDAPVKAGVSKFQDAKGLKGKVPDGAVDKTTFTELDNEFSASYKVERDVIGKQKSGNLLKGTQSIDSAERTATTRAISTEVRVNPVTGLLPTFTKEIGGVKYEDKLRKLVEGSIVWLYNRYGKDKAAIHTDKTKLHDWLVVEAIAKESQAAAPKPLKKDVNIFDAWDKKVKDFTAGGKAEEDKQATWRINKILTGDDAVAALDKKYGAIQSRTDEKKIVDALRTAMFAKYRTELIETHKGWPAFEDDEKVYIQLFKGATDDEKKQDLWVYYQTFIHEYMHSLEDPAHIAYRNPMTEQKGNKTLREGTADYFTKIVWNSITIDDPLRKKIEGALHDPLKKVAVPPLNTYHESKNAERLAGIVGLRNLAAAFFLGKVELIGKP
jgi:hypothetical protein